MAVSAGLVAAGEAFADRAYLAGGKLAPRTMEGAVIHDSEAVRKRVLSLAGSGRLPTIDGGQIELQADTLCIHGDTIGAWRLARTVREALEEAGVEVAPMGREILKAGKMLLVASCWLLVVRISPFLVFEVLFNPFCGAYEL